MSFLVAEPSASPTEAFPPKRTKNLGSLFRLSWGSTHRLRLAGTGRPQRQPQPYIGAPLGTLDHALNPGEIHLIVVVEDLEGHAGGLRRVHGEGRLAQIGLGGVADWLRNRTGALTLTASTNIFPPATEGVSTPPMKGSLNYACCVQSAGWRHGVSGRVDRRGKAYCWRQQDKGVLLFALGRQEHGHFDGKPGGLVVSISSRYLRLRWGKYHSRGDGVVRK